MKELAGSKRSKNVRRTKNRKKKKAKEKVIRKSFQADIAKFEDSYLPEFAVLVTGYGTNFMEGDINVSGG